MSVDLPLPVEARGSTSISHADSERATNAVREGFVASSKCVQIDASHGSSSTPSSPPTWVKPAQPTKLNTSLVTLKLSPRVTLSLSQKDVSLLFVIVGSLIISGS